MSDPPENVAQHTAPRDDPRDGPSVPQTVIGHAYDWQIKDMFTDSGHVEIQAWCKDKNSEPFLMRITNYPASFYIELPSHIGRRRKVWKKGRDTNAVFDYLKFCMRDNPPEGYSFQYLQKLYYYRSVGHNENGYIPQTYPMMLISFPNLKAMYACRKLLEKPEPRNVSGIGPCKFNVWESDIKIHRKMLTLIELQYSQWFEAKVQPVSEDYRIANCPEYYVKFQDIVPIDQDKTTSWKSNARIFSYDIETYSSNHNSFPCEFYALDVVYIITVVFQIGTDKSTRQRYALVFGDTKDSDRAEVIRATSEIDLVRKFEDLIIKLNPDIITGYNILGFDNKYLDARLKRRGLNWQPIGRIPGTNTDVQVSSWESSAYGHREMVTLAAEGRINIDVFQMISREYKFSTYDLNTVSKHFLKRGKHDVPAKEMFRIFALYKASKKKYNRPLIDAHFSPVEQDLLDRNWQLAKILISAFLRKRTIIEPIINVPDIVELSQLGANNFRDEVVDKFWNYYNNEETDEDNNNNAHRREEQQQVWQLFLRKIYHSFFDGAREQVQVRLEELAQSWESLALYLESLNEMTKVVEYGIEDAELVMDLFDKIGAWTTCVETSNVCGIPISDLYTRGQQIRGISLVFDLATHNRIVLDRRQHEYIKMAGGYVGDPVPGLYDNVICVDFTSLYPTIIMGNNICWTTLVPPDLHDIIPDHMCNVIQWDDPDPDYPDDPSKKIHRCYKFVKAEVRKGILPILVGHLVDERRRVRARIAETDDPVVKGVLNSRQLALKVTGNSCYGILSAQKTGKLSLVEGGMAITAFGRQSIKLANDYIIKNYGGEIIYGDSVTGDTPILCRLDGQIFYRTIDDLPRAAYINDSNGSNAKEYATPAEGLEVWSDQGFTPIVNIMRHKTGKKIYRILTHTGVVDVTEDHSLLNAAGQKVRPSEVRVGDELLHHDLPNDSISGYDIDKEPEEQIFCLAGKKIELARGYALCHDRGYSVYIDSEGITQGCMEMKFRLIPRGNHIANTYSDLAKTSNQIQQIIDLGYTDDYVYDLETANHHFAAGVGRLVVHNTDSTFFTVPQCKNGLECVTQGPPIADELSKLYPPPMKFEFEKALRVLCICPKKYAAFLYAEDDVYNKDGTLKLRKGELNTDKNEIFIRGIVLARRDNCSWQRDVYREVIWRILMLRGRQECQDFIHDSIMEITTRQIPLDNLSIVKGLGSNYKSDSYCMKVFADELRRIGKPAQPGERLSYVIVKTVEEQRLGKKMLLGYKMRLLETFRETLQSDNPEPIDHLYYIEKLLMNSVEQIYEIAFKPELLEKIKSRNRNIDRLIERTHQSFDVETQLLRQQGKRLTKKRQEDHARRIRKLERLKAKNKKFFLKPVEATLIQMATKDNLMGQILTETVELRHVVPGNSRHNPGHNNNNNNIFPDNNNLPPGKITVEL